MLSKKTIDQFRVKPGSKVHLRSFDTAWDGDEEFKHLSRDELKEQAAAILQESRRQMFEAQSRLYAQDRYAVLAVLQAMDAGGKDGTIKHVLSGINPEGCQVVSFKQPSVEELDHDYLWRVSKALPERGRIGIFNRSHYEEVLVVRVHPAILANERIPGVKPSKKLWQDRYEDINAFERHLARNGTVIVKFFLHISRKVQKERLLARLEAPEKNWKFSPGDVDDRAFWDDYMNAFDDALEATSTPWAPWYIIPADKKWVARALVARVLADTILSLDLTPAAPGPEQEAAYAAARQQLESEAA
jgi:PPK2 family polyphosphate:nucleotide phosphotransferase